MNAAWCYKLSRTEVKMLQKLLQHSENFFANLTTRLAERILGNSTAKYCWQQWYPMTYITEWVGSFLTALQQHTHKRRYRNIIITWMINKKKMKRYRILHVKWRLYGCNKMSITNNEVGCKDAIFFIKISGALTVDISRKCTTTTGHHHQECDTLHGNMHYNKRKKNSICLNF